MLITLPSSRVTLGRFEYDNDSVMLVVYCFSKMLRSVSYHKSMFASHIVDLFFKDVLLLDVLKNYHFGFGCEIFESLLEDLMI